MSGLAGVQVWLQFSVGCVVMCSLCLGWEVSVRTHGHTVLLGMLCVCVCPYGDQTVVVSVLRLKWWWWWCRLWEGWCSSDRFVEGDLSSVCSLLTVVASC